MTAELIGLKLILLRTANNINNYQVRKHSALDSNFQYICHSL